MITYIIKAILFSALLLLIYRLYLEKEKMHRFNRFYLLLSITAPFLIPLIAIPAISFIPQIAGPVNLPGVSPAGPILTDNLLSDHIIAGGNNPGGSEVRSAVSQALPAAAEYNLWISLLFIGYLIVSLTLLYRFTRNILSIYYIVTNNKSLPYLNASLILTKDCRLPHSFLKYIFVNQEDFENGAIEKEILNHELIHVRQKHSLDILLVEFLMIFAWINPLLFFCRKAIRLNHEYLADQAVVEKYSDTKSYQLLLFEKARQSKCLSLSSPFNYLLTKKRIIMMNRKPSPETAIFKKIAIIPLIAIAGLALTNSSAHELAYTAQQNQIESTPNGNGSWELVSKADVSDIFFSTGKTIDQLIIGTFKGTKGDYDYAELAITVKIYIDKEGVGSLFARFYKSDGENRELFTKDDATGSFFPAPVKVRFSSGKTIELEQFIIGNIMSDFSNIYTEISRGDLLNLILEKEEKFNVLIDLREIPVSNNKIYRFDIDPAGLKELFAKL